MPAHDATSGANASETDGFGAFGGARIVTDSAYYAKPQFWLGGPGLRRCRGVAELFRHGEVRLQNVQESGCGMIIHINCKN
jgi:hypothetical protein